MDVRCVRSTLVRDITSARPQLANLFEFPVLFYTVVVLIIVLGLQDDWLPVLCWCYVALRWVHAIVHICLNHLWIRTPTFTLGQLVLLGTWIRFGLIAFR